MRRFQHSTITTVVLGLTLSGVCSTAIEVEEVMVSMQDGAKLHTRIWKPGGGTYPVVLRRGYGAGSEGQAKRFTKAGYVYVGQSTRGHGKSEGAQGVGEWIDD